LRRHLAEKRGGNKVQSFEAMIESNAGELPDLPHEEFVDQLAVQELRELLSTLSDEVKKEYPRCFARPFLTNFHTMKLPRSTKSRSALLGFIYNEVLPA